MRHMDLERLTKRVRASEPLLVDGVMAIGLTALGWAQVWAVTYFRPDFPQRAMPLFRQPPTPMWLVLALIAGTFLPLTLRRRIPWLALLLSGSFALTYQALPSTRAFVALGPMVALYTLTSRASRRQTGLVALLSGTVVLAASILVFTDVRWVTEAVGTFALLATATFLGDMARSRREYVAQVEARAAEAERTREEEARRRVDEERLRIARDVHDVVAHSLSIVAVQAAAADTLVASEPERARESIANIRSTSRQALSELRSMLDVLRTGETDAPLEPAVGLSHLDALIAHVAKAGVSVSADLTGEVSTVPAHVSVSAYRVIQEALTNVLRHAQASSATVVVRVTPTEVDVDIIDDGIGSAATDSGQGHGVSGMRERVETLGGRFDAGARDGSGYRVHATLPVGRSVA